MLKSLKTTSDLGLHIVVIAPHLTEKRYSFFWERDTGIEKLKDWLKKPVEPMAIREELLVKIIAAELVPRSVILQEIERHRQIHMAQLSVYQEIEQQDFSDGTEQLTFRRKCIYTTLRCGIGYESFRIAWCEETIALLSESTSD